MSGSTLCGLEILSPILNRASPDAVGSDNIFLGAGLKVDLLDLMSYCWPAVIVIFSFASFNVQASATSV
jgi:hypothetical protein